MKKGLSHYENSTNAMGRVDDVWAPEVTTARACKTSVSGHNMKELFKEARLSQRGGAAPDTSRGNIRSDPSMSTHQQFSEDAVNTWLRQQEDMNAEQK